MLLKWIMLAGRLSKEGLSQLFYAPVRPLLPAPDFSLTKAVQKQDVLVAYPYQSIRPFIQLLQDAATDPAVVSIKMTLYRMEEMPARKEEVEHAEEEGIVFRTLINPVEILGDDTAHVTALRCVKMQLGEPDASGRRRPVPVAGSEFDLPVDTVIMAIGTSPNPLIKKTTPDLETNRRGCFVVDDYMHTSKDAVWAGGDAVTGAATVISAMAKTGESFSCANSSDNSTLVTSPIRILASSGTVTPASFAMVNALWPTMRAFSAPLIKMVLRTFSVSSAFKK